MLIVFDGGGIRVRPEGVICGEEFSGEFPPEAFTAKFEGGAIPEVPGVEAGVPGEEYALKFVALEGGGIVEATEDPLGVTPGFDCDCTEFAEGFGSNGSRDAGGFCARSANGFP